MQRRFIDYIVILFKGMAMGAADVVPGVSGGTIAFISGIYEELLESIDNINLSFISNVKTFGFKKAWSKVNGNFLLALILGISLSILSLAKGIKWLLLNEAILLWSFFFGLVLASIFYIGKQIKLWNFLTFAIIISTTVISYGITTAEPFASPDSNIYLFFCGAIAIVAMILPGISGSYILLLMGVYPVVMTAITHRDFTIISAIGIGVILGLLLFSRLLKWLFKKYKNQMLVVLTGLMLGSLNKVWPWKTTISTYLNSHGETKPLLEQSISPFSFNGDPQLIMSIVLAIIGFLLIIGMERVAQLKK